MLIYHVVDVLEDLKISVQNECIGNEPHYRDKYRLRSLDIVIKQLKKEVSNLEDALKNETPKVREMMEFITKAYDIFKTMTDEEKECADYLMDKLMPQE